MAQGDRVKQSHARSRAGNRQGDFFHAHRLAHISYRGQYPCGAALQRTEGLAIALDSCMTAMATTQFTGKERDAETGLDYFGARFMASAQGRFTSPDIPLLDQMKRRNRCQPHLENR